MREIWFAALIASALFGAYPAMAAPAAPPAVAPAAADNVLAVKPTDRVLGKPDAPITIVEYGSLSCPHCAHFATEVLPQLQKEWIDTGKAKLVFRDFPLDKMALRAEMVARCAPPDRYFGLIDLMFANQEKWVLAKDWREALGRLVQIAGIGKKEFDACLANQQVENEVAQSRLTASQKLGVDATPTFFINGKKFEGAPTFAGFNQTLSNLAKEKS
ncbi:MAG TPA: DsbA family protein [Stellaceae bacterium]|nr:DsbA family protein [Stellaceae bacterium]